MYKSKSMELLFVETVARVELCNFRDEIFLKGFIEAIKTSVISNNG